MLHGCTAVSACPLCPALLRSGLFGLVPGVSADFEFGVLQMSGGSVGQVAGAATVCWLETVAGEEAKVGL